MRHFRPQTLATEQYTEYRAELITTGVCQLRDRCVANQISIEEFFSSYEALKARGILYAPDFIINGGGVINAGQEAFTTYDKENVLKQVHNIYNTVYRMLDESRATGKPEGVIATEFAENRIRNGLDA